MTSPSILARFLTFRRNAPFGGPTLALALRAGPPPNEHALSRTHDTLPAFVRDCPVAQRYFDLLNSLDWAHFPERDLAAGPSIPAVPYAPFLAAGLVKLDQQLVSMGRLRRYWTEHPALLWLLGFPLVPDPKAALGFDPKASLPTARHFTRMLRQVPDALPQFLLDSSVQHLLAEFQRRGQATGDTIAFDTKHILAGVSAPCHDRLHCL